MWLKKIIENIRMLVTFLSYTMDYQEAYTGLRECDKAIRKIKHNLRQAATIGEKQRLLTALANVKSFRVQIKQLQKKGMGLHETAKHRVLWEDLQSVFNSRILTGVITNLKHKDPKNFLEDCKTIFKRRIQNALKNFESVKANATFCGEFQIDKGERVIKEFKYFTTPSSPIYKDTNLDLWFDNNVIKLILKDLGEFKERDSGWALKEVLNLGVNINKFTPQLGSSYIELPPQIKMKHACINVKNDDDACFAWAVTSALYPTYKDPQRITKYPHYSSVLKLKGIQFPVTRKQIPNFEKQNDLSINVYILKKASKTFDVLPTYLTADKKDRHINLLLIQNVYFNNDDAEDMCDIPIHYHYVWIKDLSRLLFKQLSNHKGKKYICDRCLRYFYTQDILADHTERCKKFNECVTKMPEEGKNVLQFKDFKNKEKMPFIIYADIESILKPTEHKQRYQEHIPAVIGYYLKCSYDDSLSFYRSYRGFNCTRWFANELKQLTEAMETVFWCASNIHMTADQELEFKKATHCHICEKPFAPGDKKVRDHNHLLLRNNYRGPAHEECNINYKDSQTVPVVFHNLSGYDANFIFEDIALQIDGRTNLLPVTKEKYISFTKHVKDCYIQYRFIDSYRFLNSSLDKLSSYLEDFPNLKRQFTGINEEYIQLLTKKGVMPYDYVNSFDKFDEVCLPPIDGFYNRLEDRSCPRRLYQRAQQIWYTFNCKNLGDYVDLYMKTDILLLADVFEQFRTSCHKTYNLDPAHYFTLPGFAWSCMLYKTKQQLELLTDPDQYLFVEAGVRGGLSQVGAKRRATANNKYIPTYDPSKPETYLTYFDINNQYGWAMSQSLPYSGFEWSDTNIDVLSIPDDASEGYILEVDLDYPKHLHDVHKDLPFCPQHINPKTMKPPTSSKELTKLMATLHSKEKYIIHYRALKQVLANGLRLTKIHRVLKFKQSPWLKPYIDLNTELRKEAKNEFEKNLFKLMNNAVFGKTIENIRKRINVRLVTKWEGTYGAEAYIAKPEFKSCTIFNPNLVAVELRKAQIYLDKPIYVGMTVLDLAKTTIYDFHYRYMIPTFRDDCSVLYTDTDSLIYEVHQDPYAFIKKDCYDRFDTSDYPQDNIYGIPQVNKKVLGMMKDENSGVPMTDFVGLRSKLYAVKNLRSDDDINRERKKLHELEYEENEIDLILANYGLTKKSKGVKKSVVNTRITFEDYIECLETFKDKCIQQNLIRSDKHHVYSTTQEKIALSPHDDKRYLISGTYETIPHGHYSIRSSIEQFMDID